MKITSTKASNKFQPVTISMTFESQEELDAMGSLFNTSIISDYLQNNGIKNEIYKTFREAGANIGDVKGVMNSIRNHPNFNH